MCNGLKIHFCTPMKTDARRHTKSMFSSVYVLGNSPKFAYVHLLIDFRHLTVLSVISCQESCFFSIIKQFLCVVRTYFVLRSIAIHR